MATDISICSSALVLIGADEITSFADETREAKVCQQIYTSTLDDVLSRHPWRFAVGMASLNRLVATPLFDYNYAFQLPSGLIDLLKVETPSRFEIYEDKLYCDESTVNAVYKFRPEETKFPPYFVRLMELELACLLSVSLAEDESKMELFRQLADRQERKARHTDSKLQPTRGPRDHNFALTQVRF